MTERSRPSREATIRNTKYYSRKQLTWLRGFGDAVRWVDIAEGETAEAVAGRVVAAVRDADAASASRGGNTLSW